MLALVAFLKVYLLFGAKSSLAKNRAIKSAFRKRVIVHGRRKSKSGSALWGNTFGSRWCRRIFQQIHCKSKSGWTSNWIFGERWHGIGATFSLSCVAGLSGCNRAAQPSERNVETSGRANSCSPCCCTASQQWLKKLVTIKYQIRLAFCLRAISRQMRKLEAVAEEVTQEGWSLPNLIVQ